MDNYIKWTTNIENIQYKASLRKLTPKVSLLLNTDSQYIIHAKCFDYYEIFYVIFKCYNSFRHELLESLLKKMKILYESLNINRLFNE